MDSVEHRARWLSHRQLTTNCWSWCVAVDSCEHRTSTSSSGRCSLSWPQTISPHNTIKWQQFSSVQVNLFNSSQWKSQWKASLKRWVLSPAQNWLRLTDRERRWSGSELQTTGAAVKKLHLPSKLFYCFTEHVPMIFVRYEIFLRFS